MSLINGHGVGFVYGPPISRRTPHGRARARLADAAIVLEQPREPVPQGGFFLHTLSENRDMLGSILGHLTTAGGASNFVPRQRK